jgi:hypothetical protein
LSFRGGWRQTLADQLDCWAVVKKQPLPVEKAQLISHNSLSNYIAAAFRHIPRLYRVMNDANKRLEMVSQGSCDSFKMAEFHEYCDLRH